MRHLILDYSLVRFAIVGMGGFVVDSTVFSLLFVYLELPLVTARVVAFVAAATATYLGNRLFTFQNKSEDRLAQFIKYFAVVSFSAVPNLLVFKLLTMLFWQNNLGVAIAFVSGILIGMLSNFVLSRSLVFKVA